MQDFLKVITYMALIGLILCTALDIIAQPLLWPLAGATLLMLVMELYAWDFPFIWYLYSHPKHRQHKTRRR